MPQQSWDDAKRELNTVLLYVSAAGRPFVLLDKEPRADVRKDLRKIATRLDNIIRELTALSARCAEEIES